MFIRNPPGKVIYIKQKLLKINEALDILKCENEELEEENEEVLQKFRYR